MTLFRASLFNVLKALAKTRHSPKWPPPPMSFPPPRWFCQLPRSLQTWPKENHFLRVSRYRVKSRDFTKFQITVACGIKFHWYLRTRTKIWDSQQGRGRKTSILVLAFWNFKLRVLKYPRNCRLHVTLILNLVKPLMYIDGWV